jgi:hypothetical protein
MTEVENITVYREFILPSHGNVGKRGWTEPKQINAKYFTTLSGQQPTQDIQRSSLS